MIMKNTFIISLSALTVLTSACSFSVPSREEQNQLIQDKTFPAGAPPWFANSVAGRTGYGTQNAGNGIVPQVISPLQASAAKQEAVEYPILVRAEELKERQQAKQSEVAKSPLQRIDEVCPEAEAQVNAAITTTNRQEKIKQFEALTKKCPMSADLQLWLSQEYLRANNLVAARAGFSQVLVLDPRNEDAKAGITQVERALSK